MTPALELQGISSGYGEALVLREVDLTLAPGEVLAVLGKNGMGKSTLLKTVMGFLPLAAGQVRLFGESIGGHPPHVVARAAVAYTPQEQALFQDLSVEDNLRLGLRRDRQLRVGIERAGEIFPFLPQRLAQRAGTLSGGEQKMLLVARALLCQPRLMLIDEITEGLQPSVIERLSVALRAECERTGVSILLIEQNVGFARGLAQRYAVMKRGELVDQGAMHGEDTAARIAAHLNV